MVKEDIKTKIQVFFWELKEGRTVLDSFWAQGVRCPSLGVVELLNRRIIHIRQSGSEEPWKLFETQEEIIAVIALSPGQSISMQVGKTMEVE